MLTERQQKEKKEEKERRDSNNRKVSVWHHEDVHPLHLLKEGALWANKEPPNFLLVV